MFTLFIKNQDMIHNRKTRSRNRIIASVFNNYNVVIGKSSYELEELPKENKATRTIGRRNSQVPNWNNFNGHSFGEAPINMELLDSLKGSMSNCIQNLTTHHASVTSNNSDHTWERTPIGESNTKINRTLVDIF